MRSLDEKGPLWCRQNTTHTDLCILFQLSLSLSLFLSLSLAPVVALSCLVLSCLVLSRLVLSRSPSPSPSPLLPPSPFRPQLVPTDVAPPQSAYMYDSSSFLLLLAQQHTIACTSCWGVGVGGGSAYSVCVCVCWVYKFTSSKQRLVM